MTHVAAPLLKGTTSSTLLSAAFCEACERLIFVRALIEDPRHQTRRQGSAVTSLLRQGLHAVEAQLQAVRPLAYNAETASVGRTLAGIGMAVAGLRQVHAHLGYLGTRWPLGTADLFVRKLVAEGITVPVPTLCPTDHYDDQLGEIGELFGTRLHALGLHAPPGAAAPVITMPTMDLLDPLCWAALLRPLAATMVAAQGMAEQLRQPSAIDDETYRRLCVAAVAARLVGEPTYAACAARSLLDRISGMHGTPDLLLLAHAGRVYAQPLVVNSLLTLTDYFDVILQAQAAGDGGWGRIEQDRPMPAEVERWPAIRAFVNASMPEPALPTGSDIELLVAQLSDSRPINATPANLPANFGERLAIGGDPERFYDVVRQAEERASSLATILAVGWRYKVRYTYALCAELMGGTSDWQTAVGILSGHVLERCALLQQSIEGAYVQQVFARWRDL